MSIYGKCAVFLGVVFLCGFACERSETNDLSAETVGEVESFQLHVNDVSGLGESWPMLTGLPFPEGELEDASQIRVVDRGGQ